MRKITDKKEKIVAEAIKLFARNGFEKVSIEDIRQQAKVAKGTIYYYFKSKEELFEAIIAKGEEQFYAILAEKIKATNDPRKKIMAVIEAERELVASYKELFRVFIGQLLIQEKSLGPIEKILDEGKKRGVIRRTIDVKEAAVSIFWLVAMTTLNGKSRNQEEIILKGILA